MRGKGTVQVECGMWVGLGRAPPMPPAGRRETRGAGEHTPGNTGKDREVVARGTVIYSHFGVLRQGGNCDPLTPPTILPATPTPDILSPASALRASGVNSSV